MKWRNADSQAVNSYSIRSNNFTQSRIKGIEILTSGIKPIQFLLLSLGRCRPLRSLSWNFYFWYMLFAIFPFFWLFHSFFLCDTVAVVSLLFIHISIILNRSTVWKWPCKWWCVLVPHVIHARVGCQSRWHTQVLLIYNATWRFSFFTLGSSCLHWC